MGLSTLVGGSHIDDLTPRTHNICMHKLVIEKQKFNNDSFHSIDVALSFPPSLPQLSWVWRVGGREGGSVLLYKQHKHTISEKLNAMRLQC